MDGGCKVENHYRIPPAYAISSVDHALCLVAALQVEERLTAAQAATRLGVARSTAHRLLSMLVYRDFAVQDEDRAYRAGPGLMIQTQPSAGVSELRSAALKPLRRLANRDGETANLAIRIGGSTRIVACVESSQAGRVGSREGMVFPAHRTTAGLLLLAEMDPTELQQVFTNQVYLERPSERPDLGRLRAELARVRRTGFAVNEERSERGLVAVGVPVRVDGGAAVAGLSVAMPSTRFHPEGLPDLLASLRATGHAIEADLVRGRPSQPDAPGAAALSAAAVT